MSLFVDLIVECRVGMESRSDGEDDGEEESRFLTDPRSGMSSGIKKWEMDIGEIEEAIEQRECQFGLASERSSLTAYIVNSSTASSGVTIPLLRTAGVVPFALISSPSIVPNSTLR